MTQTIIIAIPGVIWENHAYSLQGFYICKMFYEYGFNVISVSFGELINKEIELKTFDEIYFAGKNADVGKINNPEQEDNLLIYRSLKYCNLEEKNLNDKHKYISKYNKLIDKTSADYIFILGDYYSYIIDDIFHCKSIAWYPNHFEPIDDYTATVLKSFDKIICLYPSAITIVKSSLQNYDVTYVPHVVDFDNISNNKTKLTKKELKEKYNLPQNVKIITMIAGNYEKSIRKGFDVALQVFKNLLETRNNIYLYLQSFTIDLESFGFHNDIRKYINYFDIPANKYTLNSSKVNDEVLEEIYGFSDILLVSSKSEGFCLPIIESQLRGIPVVSNKFTAMRDFTYYGKSCDYEQLYYDGYGNGMMSLPSVKNLTFGLCEVLDGLNTKQYNNMKIKAIEKIKRDMSYSSVKEKIYSEIVNTNNKKKYFFCFIAKEIDDKKEKNIASLVRSSYIAKDINEVLNIEYEYIVFLNNKSKIQNNFFETVEEPMADIILKTKLKSGRMYPMSVDCIIKNDTLNNFMIKKINFLKYISKNKINTFDDLYMCIYKGSFSRNNLKINDEPVLEYY
jgi:hypothetical protein